MGFEIVMGGWQYDFQSWCVGNSYRKVCEWCVRRLRTDHGSGMSHRPFISVDHVGNYSRLLDNLS